MIARAAGPCRNLPYRTEGAPGRRGRSVPEAGDHLGEADHLLDAVGHQVSQMGQHGELGVLLAGVGAARSVLVHHQQVAEVHLGVQRLCSKQEGQGDETGEWSE